MLYRDFYEECLVTVLSTILFNDNMIYHVTSELHTADFADFSLMKRLIFFFYKIFYSKTSINN